MILYLVLIVCVLALGLYYYVSVRMGSLPTAEEYARFEALPNFKNGHFINEEPAELAAKKGEMGKVALRLLGRSANAPTEEVPQVKLSKDSFAEKPTEDSVRWLGHSMLIFELGGARFITDPVFGNAAPLPFAVTRYCESPLARKDLPRLDFILISHDHYDHLEYETVRHFRNSDVKFVTSLGVGARLRGWGIDASRIIELNWNESVEIGGVKITSLKARHFSGRTTADRNKTLWASFMFEANGKKIYFGADSGYGKHYKEIGDAHGPFDLVLLEADAWNERWPNNHLFPSEAPAAFRDLKGKTLMPVHYGVFDLALHPHDESIKKIKENAARENIPLHCPIMGDSIKL